MFSLQTEQLHQDSITCYPTAPRQSPRVLATIRPVGNIPVSSASTTSIRLRVAQPVVCSRAPAARQQHIRATFQQQHSASTPVRSRQQLNLQRTLQVCAARPATVSSPYGPVHQRGPISGQTRSLGHSSMHISALPHQTSSAVPGHSRRNDPPSFRIGRVVNENAVSTILIGMVPGSILNRRLC